MSTFIIFDIDGTLIRTSTSISKLYLEAACAFLDVPEGYDYYPSCRHVTDKAVFEHLFETFENRLPTATEVRNMQGHYLQLLESHAAEQPQFYEEVSGAQQFIEKLTQHPSVHLGVATGNWLNIAQFKLSCIDLHQQEWPIASADVFHSKADFVRDLIEKEAQHKAFQSIWYIGDSLYDQSISEELNINFLGIDYREKGHFKNGKPKPVFNNFDAVEALFEALAL